MPTEFTALGISETQIQLSWIDNENNETNYQLERSDNGVDGWALIALLTSNPTAYNDSAVECGTIYYYRLRVYRAFDNTYSEYTSVNGATVNCSLPRPPKNLSGIILSDTQIQLTWEDKSLDETNFQIEGWPNTQTSWSLIETVSPNTTTHIVTVQPCSLQFKFRVRVYRSSDNKYSPYSNIITIVPTPCPPLIGPSSLAAVVNLGPSVTLSWTDHDTTETRFEIERSSDGIDWNESWLVNKDIATYIDTTVICTNTYYYRVTALRNGDNSESLPSNVVNLSVVPCYPSVAPTQLFAIPYSQTAVQLTWKDNSNDETNFRVEHSLNNTDWVESITSGVNTTTAIDNTLMCGTLYYFRIRAYRIGDSAYSAYTNVFSVTTGSCEGAGDSLTVNSTDSVYDGSCTMEHCSLRDAVYQANASPGLTTIHLTQDTYSLFDDNNYDFRGKNALPLIKSEIVIEGNSSILERSPSVSKMRLAHVFTNGNLHLKNMIVRNFNLKDSGEPAGYGGAVYNGNVLATTDVTFVNNWGTYGGAIYHLGTNLTVTNTVFQDGISRNWSDSGQGGAIYIGQNKSAVISNSVFTNNVSSIASGGAIFSRGYTTVTGSVFTNNSATSGGAIMQADYGQLTVTNSSFLNNIAGGGGAITNFSSVVTIENSTFLGNSLRSPYTHGSAISGSGSITVRHSTFLSHDSYDILWYNNTPSTGGLNVFGSILLNDGGPLCYGSQITSAGYNILGGSACGTLGTGDYANVDPLLDELTGNGVQTPTMELLFGSPAIDAIPAENCLLTTDQHGNVRPNGAGCDSGAVETYRSYMDGPTNFTVTTASESQIDLAWTDNTIEETVYYVQQSMDGIHDWATIATLGVDAFAHSATDLNCETTYFYRVRAYNNTTDRYSLYTNTMNATTSTCTPLSAPSGLLGTMITDTYIQLNWIDNSVNETGYQVERSPAGANSWSQIAHLAANVVTYDDMGVTCNNTYNYRLRAIRDYDAQASGFSNVITVPMSVCPPPPTPTNLAASPISQTQIRLEWTSSDLPYVQFRLEYSGDGVNWQQYATVSGGNTGWTIGSLSCGTAYDFRIRAYRWSDGVYSGYSNVANSSTFDCAPGIPPDAPTNLVATALTEPTRIQLTWSYTAEPQTQIRIQVSPNGIDNWATLASVSWGTSNYMHIPVTCDNTPYFYRIYSLRTGDNSYSGFTDVASATTGVCEPTPPPPTPPIPTNLSGVPLSQTQIQLNWTYSGAGGTWLRMERSLNGVDDWSHVVNLSGGSTGYLDQPLSCSTPYFYRIRAYWPNESIFSEYSSITNVSTQLCPLPIPAAPASTPISRTQVNVTWVNTAVDVNNFYIERAQEIVSGAELGALDMGAWQQIAIIPSEQSQYQDNTLLCDTTYNYRVRGYRQIDESFSDYSDVVSVTTLPCPTPIQHTVGVYKDGVWQFRDGFTTGSADVTIAFGPKETGWTPLSGDWDGDGVEGIGLYKNGMFRLRDTATNGVRDFAFRFGPQESGWLPIVGDWNGDDVDSVGVYKNGVFLLTDENSSGAPDYNFTYGLTASGYLPIAGDWDGGGSDSVGLYKAGAFHLTNNLASSPLKKGFYFGPSTGAWLPLAGDWNADGSDTIGVYRDGVWRLINTNTANAPDEGFTFGQKSGWKPVVIYRGGVGATEWMSALSTGVEDPLVQLEPTTVPTETSPEPTTLEAAVTPAPIEATAEVVPTETALPTVEPSLEPTVEPTGESTVLPTDWPAEAPTMVESEATTESDSP